MIVYAILNPIGKDLITKQYEISNKFLVFTNKREAENYHKTMNEEYENYEIVEMKLTIN